MKVCAKVVHWQQIQRGRSPVSTPRDIERAPTVVRLTLFSVLGVLFALYALFARSHRTPVLCPFRRLTGVRCPLCGLTTSTGHLLHGNVRSAFRAHPLGPVFWILAGLWYLRWLVAVAAGSVLTQGDALVALASQGDDFRHATRTMSLQAPTPNDLETMIMGYIAQGFNIANRTPTSVTLIKRKEFSVLWAVIGFIVCVLPLLIYLIVYATESDQMVVITLMGMQPARAGIAAAASIPLTAARSPDGQYWWDGQQWRPMSQGTSPMGQTASAMNQASIPLRLQSGAAMAVDPTAPRSPDGQYWWDGLQWRPLGP